MPTNKTVNCTTWPDLKPDPDISGVGVIIGFALSAYSTLAIVIAHYLINPKKSRKNLIDRAFIKFVMPKVSDSEKWTKAMEGAVLTFSDTQIITGIAILLCGYIKLPSGISIYHWQVIVSLAWFSSLTHLTTLTSLRDYFRSRHGMAVGRSIFIGIVVVLLAAASGPTGYVSQDQTNPMPAICMFSSKRRMEVSNSTFQNSDGYDGFLKYNFPFVVLSMAFLIPIYIIRVISLFLETSLPEQLKPKIGNLFKNSYAFAELQRQKKTRFNPLKVFWNILKDLLLLAYTLSKAVYEISDSRLWQFFCLFTALAWGTLRLIGLRTMANLDEESQWGFGQLLPVLLSFLPIWTVYETIYDENKKHKKKSNPVNNAPMSPSSSSNSSHHWSGLNLDETKWFMKLIILIFGLISVLAVDVLYNFPLGQRSYQGGWDLNDIGRKDSLSYIVVVYFGMLSVATGILLIFTATGLVVQYVQIKNPNRSLGPGNRMQEVLWIGFVAGLVGGFFFLDGSDHI